MALPCMTETHTEAAARIAFQETQTPNTVTKAPITWQQSSAKGVVASRAQVHLLENGGLAEISSER